MCVRREGISHSLSNNRSSSCLILVQDFFPNTVIANNNKNMLKNTTYNLCGFIKALHWLLKRCPTTPLIFSFPNSSKQQQCNDQDPFPIGPYSSPLFFPKQIILTLNEKLISRVYTQSGLKTFNSYFLCIFFKIQNSL